MDRFSEMIAKGVASREHKTFLPKTPEQDNIVRTYNNCFGLFTDTHMSKMNENEYVITGSLCSRPDRFDSFLYSVNFGLGTAFKVNGKVTSLAGFLQENGLKGCYECLNGDHVYKVYPCPASDCSIDPACGYSVCGMDCQSPYPAQLGEKLVETIGGILSESENLEELEKKINECYQINGSDWISFNTSKGFGLCSESTGKAILFDKVNEAKVQKRYRITDHYSPMHGNDREYHQEGTLEELIKAYSYTLEVGKQYERERGNSKVNTNPKNIKQLCDNLQKASDNAARNGYSGHSYSWEEIEPLTEALNGRDDFLDKVKSTMERCIADKSIDAWFFNWADSDRKEKTEAEKYISSILPGKWKFVEITGNGTNIGTGWFKNKEYGITIGLSCYNEGKALDEYIDDYDIEDNVSESINESVMKTNQNDRDGFSHGPFFGMKVLTDTGRWLDVDEIRVEDKDISGNPADKGMQYCTLVFGSMSKTKQITKVNKPKEKAKENNWGYNWMPSPELLAEILKAFGSDKVSFDFNDKNLEGVNWKKYNVYI